MLPPQGEARAAPGRAGAGERKWGAPEGARRGVVNAEPCICSPRPGTSESQAEELTTEHDAPPVPRLSWFLFAELRHLPGSPLFVQGPGVLLPETLAARGPLWLDPAPPRLPERWRSLAWRWEPAPQGLLLCGNQAAASGAELELCQGHS